jgi:hypothetical protein
MKHDGIAAAGLRSRAETFLAGRSAANDDATEIESKRALHELQVHQVELEMQHEELLQANRELTQLRDEYRDLFDFSPVGYFKMLYGVDEALMNLTLLTLLDLPSDKRLNSLVPYIVDGDQGIWIDCIHYLRLGGRRRECWLQLVTASKLPLFVKVFLSRFDTLHEGSILGAVVPIDAGEYRSFRSKA